MVPKRQLRIHLVCFTFSTNSLSRRPKSHSSRRRASHSRPALRISRTRTGNSKPTSRISRRRTSHLKSTSRISRRRTNPSKPTISLYNPESVPWRFDWRSTCLQRPSASRDKAFALFPKFPPELRRMVWIFARPPPRVIKLLWAKVGGDEEDVIYSTAKVPSLLQTRQESRKIAKGWYELTFR
jgi:2EXR family